MTDAEKLIAIKTEAWKLAHATEYFDEFITGKWMDMPLMVKNAVNRAGNEILHIVGKE